MHRLIRVALLFPCTALLVVAAGSATAESRFEREVQLLTKLLAPTPGSSLADIGAGEGEYAIALAPLVGAAGKVYATELGEEARATLAEHVAEAGIEQVVVAEAQIAATGLPAGCCEGAFLRTVYHHLTDPEPFAEDLFATLKPGGRLVVVDFEPTLWLALFPPEGIPENRGGHGIKPALVIEELEAAGFVHQETIEDWPSGFLISRYGLVFSRP
jgi:predicted methyltransferase